MSVPGRFTDADGNPVAVPEPPPTGSYYRAMGDWQGAGYERNAFARGTVQEAAFLVAALGLSAGDRVLDVGCGNGRHVRALRQRSLRSVGIDLSHGLLSAAGVPGLVQADAARLPFAAAAVDAALSLCQGGFGCAPTLDTRVLAELGRVVRCGGRLALTAFSLPFVCRFLDPQDALDVARGLHHHRAEVRGRDGAARSFDLWTTCYSPAHLVDLVEAAGFAVDGLWGVEPGAYRRRRPTLADPELLVVATRRSAPTSLG